MASTFERSETPPIGLRIPEGGKWARVALRLRSVDRDGAWYCVDKKAGRTTGEQTARKYNLSLAFGAPWEFGFIENVWVDGEEHSQIWVRWIGPES